MLSRNRRIGALLSALVMLVAGLGRAANQDAAAPLIIENVTIVDPGSGAPRAGTRVVIRDGRIAAIERAGGSPPPGMRVVNARAKYLIPGLWDLHVHLGMAGPEALGLLAAHGVTGVRDLGGDLDSVLALRRKVDQGALLGPRIRAAGVILESPRFLAVLKMLAGRIEAPFGGALERMAEERIGIATPEEARAAVVRLAEAGVDCIKVRSVASLEVLRALAEEAGRHGLRLVGHLPAGIPLAQAVEAGQRSFEHFLLEPGTASLEKEEETIQAMRASGAVVVPTLVTARASRLMPASQQRALVEDVSGRLDPRRRFVGDGLVAYWRLQMRLDEFESPADWAGQYEANLALLRKLNRAGVPILPGTDLGARLIYPGWSLHEELELLVSEAGLSPAAALGAATRGAARLLGLEAELGSVEPGKRADLVLLAADPLAAIANTRRIEAVVLNGRFLDRRALAGLRDGALRRDPRRPERGRLK